MNLKNFYSGKRILVTGHTGFKGAWLCLVLHQMGANVKGISLPPDDRRGNFYKILKLKNKVDSSYIDIRNYRKLEQAVKKNRPELIFHLAAQPYVIKSYTDPIETITTNIVGTTNILEISKDLSSLKALLNITTDKCYENEEKGKPFRESDKLGGKDIYSASKASSELITKSYYESFLKNAGKSIGTARAGNVVGGGDFGEDRLIPDIFDSIFNNKDLIIRNPKSVRPWQYILDVINGYLIFMYHLSRYKKPTFSSYNFAPSRQKIVNVREITESICTYFRYKRVKYLKHNHGYSESRNLLLSPMKAKKDLKWATKYKTMDAIKETIKWNEVYHSNRQGIERYSVNLIKNYFGN